LVSWVLIAQRSAGQVPPHHRTTPTNIRPDSFTEPVRHIHTDVRTSQPPRSFSHHTASTVYCHSRSNGITRKNASYGFVSFWGSRRRRLTRESTIRQPFRALHVVRTTEANNHVEWVLSCSSPCHFYHLVFRLLTAIDDTRCPSVTRTTRRVCRSERWRHWRRFTVVARLRSESRAAAVTTFCPGTVSRPVAARPRGAPSSSCVIATILFQQFVVDVILMNAIVVPFTCFTRIVRYFFLSLVRW